MAVCSVAVIYEIKEKTNIKINKMYEIVCLEEKRVGIKIKWLENRIG